MSFAAAVLQHPAARLAEGDVIIAEAAVHVARVVALLACLVAAALLGEDEGDLSMGLD